MVTVGQLDDVPDVADDEAVEAVDTVEVTAVLTAVCCLTGDKRTRRTLPSAETFTNLTGTIFDPGGTICAGRTFIKKEKKYKGFAEVILQKTLKGIKRHKKVKKCIKR